MLKIFLVEDESIVREGLRDNIPWQQYGYDFVGEASDGEMALTQIRKLQPDVLITDIKMPFMDGLSLSSIVSQEFPNIKIVIISGYDDFEYARQAIKVGVEQYLLKPITRATMQKVLLEIREKIETEQEQKNYLDKFKSEIHEYEQFSRRNFFEKLFAGQLSVQQIYEEAQKLSIEINAACYNLILVTLQEKKNQNNQSMDSEIFARTQEEMLRYFMRFTEYMIFRWNITTYGILLKGETSQMQELSDRCISNIQRICTLTDTKIEWHVALGEPVERLSQLAECYGKVNHLLAYRFLKPSQHILTHENVEVMSDEVDNLGNLDVNKVDPEIIKSFLSKGSQDEISDFVEGYLQSLNEVLKSKLFRDYLLLSVRFTTLSYIESIGCSQEELLSAVPTDRMQDLIVGMAEMKEYILQLFQKAVSMRDRESNDQGKKVLKKALEYIDENYDQESISLNKVAGYIEVSANYFSAIFSQEMEMTFIEYVTQKRMEKAKKLLRQSDKHTSEIALSVGYKDPHYFSFVFKKTQGCTPREYRNRKG